MKKACCFIFIVLAMALRVSAQELVGKITDADSAATPLYPAEVTQSQAGKVTGTYKTFFDGTFHMKVKGGQSYQVKASFPGRKDSTVTISVDKNGTLVSGTLFIHLHKDGLRLMGYVIDRDEDVPIKDAGITIRNVMTRMEEKYFTDVNGYYNLKMDFETNYTFRIDKRSPGILNKYQDTSFNISTIGFNQPLDFKLDIKLGPAAGVVKARPEYNPYALPDNKNLKPVVQVMGKKDSIRIRDQALALDDLNKKLNSKDSAIASIDKKLKDIDQAKKDDKSALNTEDINKKNEAAWLKAEQEKQQAAAEAKKREQDQADIARVAKLRADNELKTKADQAKIDKENAAIARADSALLAEKLKKEKAARDLAAAKQAKDDEIRLLIAEREKKAEEKLARKTSKRQAKQQAEEKKKQLELATAELKVKEAAEQQHRNQEDSIRARQLAADLKRKADEALLSKQTENKSRSKADQTKVNKENAAIARADSALLADKQRKEQKERELTAMKIEREEAAAKSASEKRDKEAKEKIAKKESKREAKELAEQTKLHKKIEEEAQRIVDEKQRTARRKSQADAEQHDLEAKRAQEEQEKKNLISQREKLLHDQQVHVTENSAAKPTPDNNQKKAISDWEKKLKDEARKKADTASANVYSLNTVRSASVKVVKTKGVVKNGQTEEPLANVSINIRRLNSIVSQEVSSDSKGNYSFLVDSGYFYLVSYYKDKYEISKQILDLTSYAKPEYTMLIQYLKEHDEFDPNSKMPLIQFVKNSSKVPTDLWSDIEPIVKMMKDVPDLKMKIYGLASADEDYPMELSITRARLVADIMLESGIKPTRIRINGVGAFRPRSGCVEGKRCADEQYQLDRVVMYSVVKD